MNQPKLKNIGEEARSMWWQIHETNDLQNELNIDNSIKINFLTTIYNGLYGELRDTHTRQQQVITWGSTVLAGGGLLTLIISNAVSIPQKIIFAIALGLLTFILTRTITFLSEDRMSIARQLDRIHQIMGAFTKDYYVNGTTLLDPIWYGWGFDKDKDINWRLIRIYTYVLWAIFLVDVILLFTKA